MPTHPPRDAALLQDIIDARHDLIDLAVRHNLSPTQLADWARDAGRFDTLADLARLADAQTQLHLARYRLFAAARLIRLATEEADATPDVARRACVDLLKLDLAQDNPATHTAPAHPLDPFDHDAIRAALYGSTDAGPKQREDPDPSAARE